METQTIALLVIIGAAFLMFITRDRRWNLAALAVVQLGCFLLIYTRWPLEQAGIKLVGGWMAVAVLGATAQSSPFQSFRDDAGIVFRILIFTLLFLYTWSVSDSVGTIAPDIPYESALAGLLLALIGMVRSGTVQDPLQLFLSILLAYAGFETIFSYINSSALMTALLAAVNLGMALIGAYLVAKSPRNPEDEA